MGRFCEAFLQLTKNSLQRLIASLDPELPPSPTILLELVLEIDVVHFLLCLLVDCVAVPILYKD